MLLEVKRLSLGGIGNFNCYLLKTDKGFLLVDTGVSRLRKALEGQLEEANCAPGNLRLILLTNGTMDATGNALYVREKFGGQIAMHRSDLEMVEDGKYPQREFRSRFPEIVYKLLIKRIGKRMTAALARFHPDLLIDEGFDFSPFGLSAQILHAPGFTPGSICLLLSDGTLFSGNTIINQGGSVTTPFVLTTYGILGASLEKLKDLPIKTIYPGMGNPLPISDFKTKAQLQ